MGGAKKKSTESGAKFLREAFALEQELLRVQLQLSSESVTHAGAQGDVNESYFIDVLRKYLPRRYAIDKGIVIDSLGATSDQIDVIVFDNQYTPTLLDQQSHRFVPAEAVYAVFEVKPTVNKGYMIYAGDKAQSVRILRRTSVPITQASGITEAKEPFPIISGIVASDVEWADGFSSAAFINVHNELEGDRRLDAGLAVSGGSFDCYDADLKVGSGSQSLAYFLFRFLQKLQSLGTVTAVDWNAYASALADE